MAVKLQEERAALMLRLIEHFAPGELERFLLRAEFIRREIKTGRITDQC